jgi:hypothetical protein
MLDFKGHRRTISGIGMRRTDGGGFPSVANVLCWDGQHSSWVHVAHITPQKPAAAWQVYQTVIPKVQTTALMVHMLSEGKTKYIELGQIIVFEE